MNRPLLPHPLPPTRGLDASSVRQNADGRFFTPGRAYSYAVNVGARDVHRIFEQPIGQRPTAHLPQQYAHRSDSVARKVIYELNIYGEVQNLSVLPTNWHSS
mmetsp:Transcript_22828/g.47423  ORF Transcript_22828/g.47423 Transcript_22828/m.47423 type:complete len:102 (+) Transcript_22828:2900-3205(+)